MNILFLLGVNLIIMFLLPQFVFYNLMAIVGIFVWPVIVTSGESSSSNDYVIIFCLLVLVGVIAWMIGAEGMREVLQGNF